jgi:cysteine dioxygenase
MIPVEKLVEKLRSLSDEDFTCDNVYEILAENPVRVDSISRYFFWSDKFYTRNLIYKDGRFELIALCWEIGQSSQIHNHANQKCWMTVPLGRLRGQNFRIAEIDEEKNYCKLVSTETFELSNWLAAKVELEEPIHQISNLPEFRSRAVSLHIYSKPFDRCLCYCTKTNTFKEIKLSYTSIYGKLCENVVL